jgi:UDP-N-acetyl-D-mannosaminuronic acid transferase (WecB/TagA/CpsF family)
MNGTDANQRRLSSTSTAECDPRSSATIRVRFVRILGVRVDALTYASLLDQIEAFIGQGTPHQITTTNPEFVMLAQRDPAFREVLEAADLCMAEVRSSAARMGSRCRARHRL